jgi:hypothetical protein
MKSGLSTGLAVLFLMVSLAPLPHASAASDSCQTLADRASTRWDLLPAPTFADLYVVPIYLSRFDDLVVYSQARAGVALGTRGQWETYLGLRYTDDRQSLGGRAPAILSDNAAIVAVGTRFHPFARFPISIYGEAGRAYDLIDRNRDRWRDDFRAGLSYFDRWAPSAQCASGWRFPLRRSSSLYADASVYSRYDRNWIGYLQWREGVRALEQGRMQADLFLYLGGAVDSNDDFFNNVAEGGVGAALVPSLAWPVTLRYTAVRGRYLDVSGGERNPYNPTYTDHRWEFIAQVRF